MIRVVRALLTLFLISGLISPLLSADEHKVQTLGNGLSFVTYEARKVPLVTIVLTVKAGAFTENLRTNGLTHLWEHMFFKGNAQVPRQEAFHTRIRELGIIYNGDTHAEMVRYYFTLPSAFLAEGLDFMYHAIATPLIDVKELERERQVVLDEYDRNASQIGFELYKLRQATIYGRLAYLRDPLGKRANIETADRKALMQMKDEVFVPKNSALLVAGDFKASEARELMAKIFSRWKNPPKWRSPVTPPLPEFPKKSLELVRTHLHARNISITTVFKGPKAQSNPKDAYIADVLSGLVNHRLSGFVKHFVDSGLTYGAGLGYLTQSQAAELTISALTSSKNYEKFREELPNEIQRWGDKDAFSESQLEDVRRSLRIQRAFDENRPSEYVKNLGFWWAITGLPFYNDYIEALSKVSLVEVGDFVRRYLIDKSAVTSILLSPSDASALKIKDSPEPNPQGKDL